MKKLSRYRIALGFAFLVFGLLLVFTFGNSKTPRVIRSVTATLIPSTPTPTLAPEGWWMNITPLPETP